MSYSRYQALTVATSFPWTRDLRHVKAVIPRSWARSQTGFDPKVKSTKPKDRIKWWNIVPGDQVRVLGEAGGAIHEIRSINRLANRVHLKTVDTTEDAEKQTFRSNRQVHYSKCQLFVGHHTFPPLPGETESRTIPVFATRLTTSTPRWLPSVHRYDWDRYAVNTVPRLPGHDSALSDRIHIAWPEPPKKPQVEPSSYDTLKDTIMEITYKPPPLPSHANSPAPEAPSEQAYISSLIKSDDATFESWQPVEVHVRKELTNPHSRAKKQERWQAYEMYKRSLLHQYVQKEYQDLQGRTRREARAEATWRWRQKLVQERKAEVRRRRINRGDEAALAAKQIRKARKQERIQRKLQSLVLQAAPNQLVPRSQPSM